MRSKDILTMLLCGVLAIGALAPTSTAQLSSTAAIANALPVVVDIDVPATVDPTAGTTTSVAVTVTAADNNGWQDLTVVLVTIRAPDGSVHTAQAAATSNEDGSGVAKTYSYSFVLQHYDAPATGSDRYQVVAVAEDAAGTVSLPLEATFQYTELAALSLAESALAFGTVQPGARSNTAQLSVTNQGNVAIDLETSGTALVHAEGASIAVDRVRYDLESNGFESEKSLTGPPHVNEGFALAPGPSATQGTFWALEVPGGEDQYIPAGSYVGTLTVSAIKT